MLNADPPEKEGPLWQDGYFTIEDKPGCGVEINPDVAKADLAPGEVWWWGDRGAV